MDWDDLRYLLSVQREGSLAAAARALRVDQTTVSRRVAALEERLGAKLFEKKAGKYQLTTAGERACAIGEQMESAARALGAEVGGRDTRVEGTVRLTAPEGFVGILSAALATLRERHPGLLFEVQTSTTSLNLVKGEADIAIRMHHQSQPSLISIGLGAPLQWGVFASEAYLRRRGIPESLSGHDVIGYDDSMARSPGGAWLARSSEGATVVLRTNNLMSVMAAISAGMGIGTIPEFIAARDHTLRRAMNDEVGSTSAQLVIPKELLEIPRIRATVDHLTGFVRAELAVLHGRFSGR